MPDAAPSPTDAEIEALLRHAVRAPSVLNTQPWRFAVGDGSVRVYADRDRQLAALDPDGRELTMSCGAAVLYLRIAARHAGWDASVEPFPDASDPDLLAAVTFAPGHRPGSDDRLFRALALRRTHRQPFAPEPVPFGVASELAGAASAEGASLRAVTDRADKDRLAGLVVQAITAQGQDAAVVADVKRWLRPSGDPRPDGVRDTAQGPWDWHAATRTTAASVAAYKGRVVREAPAVVVLWTPGDAPADWLAAGQALARVLVVAADRGLAASYANEPVEARALRPRVAEVAGSDGAPQALFRVGYPEPEPGSSRRPARDVTERGTPSGTSPAI